MGSRSPDPWFVALALGIALALIPLLPAAPVAAAAAPQPGGWLRPVPGALVRPFVEPVSRYGAGHRGADLAAPIGAPVMAANAGEVSFAGSVAGTLHVVVAHAGGLRTSYSFLAGVTVRRGQRVGRGDVVGTAGGGTGEHAAVLHFGLRVGDRYVDPMALFSPTDLTRLIRLVPVDEPDQRGLDPPAVESRSLAEALHLPRGVPGLEPEPEPGVLDTVVAVVGHLGAPLWGEIELVGRVARQWVRGTVIDALLTDAGTIAGRLRAWAASRADCVTDTTAGPGGGGSGHSVMAVAGINSSTDPATGATFALDTERLGYRAGEVRYFSYADDGGPYRAEQTKGDFRGAVARLYRQLQEMQREHPGREVDLIGHSQGGVVIRHFVSGHDSGDPTLPPLGTVVTAASPLQGAALATAVRRVRETGSGRAALHALGHHTGGVVPSTSGVAVAQLAEDSAFMRDLHARPLPGQLDFTTLGAVDDAIVTGDHAGLPGTVAHPVNPPGVSDHRALLTDPKTLDAIRHALEQRPLPCVGVVDGVRSAVEPVVISRVERTAGEAGHTVGRVADALERAVP